MSASTADKRLRIEISEAQDALDHQDSAPGLGAPSLVARTKALHAYPAVAGVFYACEPLTVLGPEVEGSSGVVSPSGATFLAFNLGASVPPQSSAVLVTFVNHRWVFRYDG